MDTPFGSSHARLESASALAAPAHFVWSLLRTVRGIGGGRLFRAQSALGLLPRGEGSMRFHPKSRASTDQRPGPNIARAPPMVPASRHTRVSIRDQQLRDLDHGDDHAGRRVQSPREEGLIPLRTWQESPVTAAAPQCRPGVDNEHRARDDAHEQQTNARPTVGECGIQASQHAPGEDLPRAAQGEPPYRAARVTLSSRRRPGPQERGRTVAGRGVPCQRFGGSAARGARLANTAEHLGPDPEGRATEREDAQA